MLARIEAAQSALWRAELTRRVLVLVISVMAITLFWIVVDQWIWSPGVAGRSLIAVALMAAGAAYAYLRLWPVMHLRVREDYAARALERDHPELGHSLSSYVSLRQQRVNHPRGQLADRVVQSVGANAATKLKHIDAPPSEATGLISWWVTAIALLAVIAAYALASPKNSAQSVARLVRPLASLDAPRRVQITDVSPGDTETLAGRSLEIAATVKNLRDDEPVYFRWESNQSAITKTSASLTQPTDDSATGNQQQTRMIANETDGQLDQYIATVPISHHAHGTRRYHIVAGDASSGPYEVTIRDTPVVQIREVVYLPPAYTGKTKHTGHTGSIQSVDGTKVELIATINRPITRAIIEFNPRKVGQDIQATAGASEMQISGDGTTVRFDFALRSRKGGAIELQDYRIRVWDDAGQTNGDPIIYPIRVIEDLPPEITIVVPQQSTKDVPIDSEQVFEIHAADVDYGLAEVEIEIHRGIDLIARSTLWKDPVGKRGNQVIEYRFRPSRMIVVGRDNGIRGRRGGGLIVGDEVEVVAIATDNRTDPNDKTIVPGVTRTQPVLLRITAASAVPNNQDPTQQPKQGEGDSSQEQGEGQSGEGEQGGSGGGQSGKGQQGKGQQGEGQQGEGQQGEGQQGEGQQGEGQQGEGQQSDGQQDMPQDNGSSESGEQTDPQGGQPQDSQGQSGESSDPSDAEQQPSSDQNAGSGNQGGKPNQGQTSGASDGKSDNAPEQPPQDDAEAFERIQDYLNEKRENQSRGQNQPQGQSSDQNQPNDTPENRNSNDESGDGSSGQSSEDRNTNPNDDAGSQRDPQNSGSDNDAMTNPNEGDSGSDSEKGDSAGQPEGGPKQGDSEQGDGEKGTGQQEDGQQSDGRQNDDRQGDSEQDAGKQDTGMNDDAGGQSGSEGSQEQSSTESGEDGANEKEGGGEKEGAGEKEAGDNSSGENTSGENGSQSESASGENGQPNESTPDGDSGKQGSDSQSGDPSSGKGENQPSESGDDSSSSDSDAGDSEAGDSGSKSGGDDSESSRSNPNGAPDKGAPNQNRDQQPNPSEDTDSESGLNDQPSGNSDSGTQSGDQSGQPSPTSDESGGESAQGGGSGQSGGGVGEEQSIENELPDPVDLEYTKAATDMVLDYLDETRTDPDPELLERLKWTDQDLKRFRQRWQDIKPIDGGPRVDAPPQSEIEEALRSLGMRPPGTAESNRRDQSDDIRGLRDSGNRRPAPADIRDAFEAFRRGLSQP